MQTTLSIVVPICNERDTWREVIARLDTVDLSGIQREIILVDDGSDDKTAEVAKKLNIFAIVHPKNLGYGGNQKTCYQEALKRGADIVVMLHPELVVLGGSVAQIGDLLFDTVREVVVRRVGMFPVDDIRILPSQLGNRAGIFGGIALAAQAGHV